MRMSLTSSHIGNTIRLMNMRTEGGYRSPLRQAQAAATAQRILDAAVALLERRPGALSIPAVAREAGVSVPTVYHHFSDKATLIRAISDHLDARTGLSPLPDPTSAAELAEHVAKVAPHLSGRQALMAPAFRSAEGIAIRREQVADRKRMVGEALTGMRSRLSPDAFEKLVSVVTVLCTSETLGFFQEYLGASGEEAAAAVAWAIHQLCEEPTR